MIKSALVACALAIVSTGAAAQTLDRIKNSSEMRIGFRVDAPPLSYIDAEGLPAGYSPTVCSGVAQGLANGLGLEDLRVTFLPVSAEDRFDKIASGEIDLLCGAATITLRRSNQVDFSIPIYVDGAAAMLPQEAEAEFTILAGQKIGVRADTTTEEALNNTLRVSGIEADVVAVENHGDGIQGMLDGTLQAYFADQSILLGLDSTLDPDDKLKVMDRLLTIEKQGLAMARGDADFRLAVDSILSGMYSAGLMQQIFNETLPGATPGLAMQALYLIAPTME